MRAVLLEDDAASDRAASLTRILRCVLVGGAKLSECACVPVSESICWEVLFLRYFSAGIH